MTQLTPVQMVAAYIKLRDFKKAADDEYKKSMQRTVEAMEKLEGELLKHLNETGADSLSSKGVGVVFRNTQFSATVENREAFKAFVEQNELWEAVDFRANKSFIKDYVEAQGVPVPGIKLTQVATVGVRRS